MSINEDIWPAEFERIGEGAIRNSLALGRSSEVGINTESKREAAFRWLRQKERDRERRHVQIHWYAKWAFRAAVAALVVSLLGVLLTVLFAFAR
jgi:hypothetical protein